MEDELSRWATGRLLSTAARLVEHAWDTYLSRWLLNHSSFGMLALLHGEPLTQRTLATHLHMEDQTVSRMVERLERLGYVSRSRGTRDRRQMVVSLTGAGHEVYLQALAGNPSEHAFDAALGPRGKDELRASLTRLVHDMSAHRWGHDDSQ